MLKKLLWPLKAQLQNTNATSSYILSVSMSHFLVPETMCHKKKTQIHPYKSVPFVYAGSHVFGQALSLHLWGFFLAIAV